MAVDILEKNDTLITAKDINNNSDKLNLNKENNDPILSQYEKLTKDLVEDERCVKEFSLGKRIGFYRMRGDLGSGNFAKVKLGYHCLVKEKVAIKILDKNKLDEKTQKMLSREISCMERLQHPNLIRMFEVLETMDHLYMIMEYASNGELFHKIINNGKFSEAICKSYFSQLISAVSHMHGRNIIHRDIKAENVFLHINGTVKLGDLGFSTIISSSEQQLTTFCGSPPYAAPELFKDDFYLGAFVDVWALGILLYFMVTGSMPFRADTVGKLKRKILLGTFTVPDYVSEPCRFLICQILRLIPVDRFSVTEIMRSVWLEGASYPRALSSNHLKPSNNMSSMTDEEQDAMEQVKTYGITDKMIEDCPDSSRSNVNGVFRLSVYQVQKKALERQQQREEQARAEANAAKNAKGRKPQSSNSKAQQSKFCTLL